MWRWINTTLSALLLTGTVGGTVSGEPFAGWPKSWSDVYYRFEKFIATQNEYVMPPVLTILPQGKLEHDIDLNRKPTLVLFTEGRCILESGCDHYTLEGNEAFFQPGIYAACFKSFDNLFGYQYSHPLTWFQVDHVRNHGKSAIRGETRLRVSMLAQPQPTDDYWPNDRLLRFWDFQVFPRINPLEFYRNNNKVSPKVTLAVTNAGIVQRDKLDDPAEKILRWRIYLNGRLVERGSATGDINHAVRRGTGSYVAFVGLEGPNGFMPVSNLLEFPLFPERNGTMAVLPSLDEDGLPYRVHDALKPDQCSRLLENPDWTAPRDASCRSVAIDWCSTFLIDEVKKQELVSLWGSWSWQINTAKSSPNAFISCINLATRAE